MCELPWHSMEAASGSESTFTWEMWKFSHELGTCRCTYTGMSRTQDHHENCTCGISTEISCTTGMFATLGMDRIWGTRIRISGLRELVAADHRNVDAKNSLLHSLHCGCLLCVVVVVCCCVLWLLWLLWLFLLLLNG